MESVFINPTRVQWDEILKRPAIDNRSLESTVVSILEDVKLNGDAAVKKYAAQFDGVELNELKVSEKEIDEAIGLVDEKLKAAIQLAEKNISLFHENQKEIVRQIQTTKGVICWRKSIAIQKVGLYIPGGTAPLFSTLLMLGIPAVMAGCNEIVVCTPCDKNGKINPVILYVAQLIGLKNIYKIGGVQAIAAMAFGTSTVSKVYKIFGPGNQYVTCAKQLVNKEGVAIDMPAGPSEVAVYADETCDASFVAADLLSQAEHGVDSQVVLVANSEMIIEKVKKEILVQLEVLPRKDIAAKSLANSRFIVMQNIDTAFELLNEYAAEHLIIASDNAKQLAEKVINAGSVFLGHYSPESVGDYASGTNHTLPTDGYAKAYSGVSLDSFVKKITFQQLSKEGIKNIGNAVESMATAEGLDAHKNAVTIRLKVYKETIMKFELENIIRDNIKKLKPYSSARHEFKGEASVFLDANENAYGLPLVEAFNRYPNPLQWQLKFQLAKIKGVPAENIFIGNGSDEVIDLAYRIFCNPGEDNVIICPPTYGMYEVSADINDVAIKKVNLLEGFQLDTEGILNAADENTKLLFICSPNNPTGNNMNRNDVELLLNNFPGIIIIDEAYINYSRQKPFIQELTEYPNLIVMQTLSKAWGLAALRLGLGYASLDIIDLFNKVKPPYNINKASQLLALDALENTEQVNNWIKEVVSEKEYLAKELVNFSFVKKVYPSDANFFLIKVENADELYDYLSVNKIVVRNRSKEIMCENCLRITIGTPEENQQLLTAFKNYK